jgi:DNA-binding NarL/FixJ family response regulator
MLRVLVVSPYPTVRAGLRALLSGVPDIEVVWEAQGPADIGGPWPARPDLALVDEANGASAVEAIEARAPELGIVLLIGEQRPPVDASGSAPRGYLMHDATGDELIAAVRAVAQGLCVFDPALLPRTRYASHSSEAHATLSAEDLLTPRELEVLHLLAAGLPNKIIAIRLGVSEHTAKFHVSSVLSKLGAASRTEAVTTAARRGLLLL